MWARSSFLVALVVLTRVQARVFVGPPEFMPSPLTAGVPSNYSVRAFANGNAPNETLTADLQATLLGSDLDTFQATFPAPSDSKYFSAPVTFPTSGTYLSAFKYYFPAASAVNATEWSNLTVLGAPATAPFNTSRVDVPEVYTNAAPFSNSMPMLTLSSLQRPARQAAYHITLDGPTGRMCRPRTTYNYTFSVMTANPMTDVTNLQPLWGADAHVAVVDRDLRTYMGLFATPAATAMAPNMHAGMDHSSPAAMGPAMDHAAMNHGAMGGPTAEEGGQLGRRLRMAPPTPGAAQRRFGPNLETAIEFPREGVYAIIAQMRRGDDLILAPFYITCGDVDPNAAAASPSAAPAPAPAPEPSPTTSSAGVVGGAAQAAVGVVAAAALAMLW